MNRSIVKYGLRGAVGFGASGLFAAVGIVFLMTQEIEIENQARLLAIAAFFLSGALGAAVVTWEKHPSYHPIAPVLGFGLGLVITMYTIATTAYALEVLRLFRLAPFFSWAILVGLGAFGGAFGGALGGGLIRNGLTVPGALAFGIAGAIGAPFGMVSISLAPDYRLAIAVVIPYMIGGGLFGVLAAIKYPENPFVETRHDDSDQVRDDREEGLSGDPPADDEGND